jgi:hypothetical protein
MQVDSFLEYIMPDPPSRAAYFSSGEVSPGDQLSREAELGEIMHIRELASEKWETLWQGPHGALLNEDVANSLVFYPLIVRVPIDGNITAQLCVPICISLIVI